MDRVIFAKLDFQELLKSPKKGQRRQIQIAEATIEVLFNKGLVGFSYDQVAKKCKIARGVIYSYFPTLTDLLLFTSGLIRYQYQSYVIEKVAKQKTSKTMLEAYVEHALSWIDVSPKHANVWILFFHHCSISKELSEFNKQIVDMGTLRITGLLTAGIQKGEFGLAADRAALAARQIQLLITGTLISRATELGEPEYWAEEKSQMTKQVLEFVKSEV